MSCSAPNSTVQNTHHIIWEAQVCRLFCVQSFTPIMQFSIMWLQSESKLWPWRSSSGKDKEGGTHWLLWWSFDICDGWHCSCRCPCCHHTLSTANQPHHGQAKHREQSEMILSDTILSSFIKLSLSACWYTGKSSSSLGTTSYWLLFFCIVSPHTTGTAMLVVSCSVFFYAHNTTAS